MTKLRKSAVAAAPPAQQRKTKIKVLGAGDGVTAIGSPKQNCVTIPDELKDTKFKRMGGSKHPAFNISLLREVLGCVPINASTGEGQLEARDRAISMAMSSLEAFKPTDEIEGMIAAQATALHLNAMECFRRAHLNAQNGEVASRLLRDGANMARGMTDMLAAFDRKRGKGPQVIRVERMVVQGGGQAVVGNVQAGAAPLPAEVPRALEPAAPGITLDAMAEPVTVRRRGRGRA